MAESGQRGFAVAVFVKTPGLSPLKTRLAKTIGEEAAHRFYKLSCAAIRESLFAAQASSSGKIIPYWAVAEDHADAAWLDFPVIRQGPGGLGDKLDRVYAELITRHGGCMLIGADAPHVRPAVFLEVLTLHAKGSAFVIGPASDGGFYLFSGQKPVSADIWRSVPYSAADTLNELRQRIETVAPVEQIARLTDVDTENDLRSVLDEMACWSNDAKGPPALEELAAFMKTLLSAHGPGAADPPKC